MCAVVSSRVPGETAECWESSECVYSSGSGWVAAEESAKNWSYRSDAQDGAEYFCSIHDGSAS